MTTQSDPVSKKRKSSDLSSTDQTVKLNWHPKYPPAGKRVTLGSRDGQLFSVYEDLLHAYR
jgi:hypothetical protein